VLAQKAENTADKPKVTLHDQAKKSGGKFIMRYNILIPASSQFRTKAETHEDRHAYQWTTGMNVDLLQIADLMTHLSPLTDATQAGLQTKINNEFIAWYNAQIAIANNRRNAAEKDAYSVSDAIAPQYLYQNCGRFN